MRIKLPFFIVLFLTTTIFSQNIKVKIIDYITQKGIANVAVINNIKQGTTTNELGIFSMDITNISSLSISCLGYKDITISIEELKQRNFIIELKETTTELEEIQINTKEITLNMIIANALLFMNKSKVDTTFTGNFYFREFSKSKYNTLELDLKKNTVLTKIERKKTAREFQAFADEIKNNPPETSREFFGSLKGIYFISEKLKKPYFLMQTDSVEGYKKTYSKSDMSIEDLQSRASLLVLKNLDTNKTYKVKTGLFKVEDSLSIKETEDDRKRSNSFNSQIKLYDIQNINKKTKSFKYNDKNNYLSIKHYNHILLGTSTFRNEDVYVIGFSPKSSKAKFEGKLYINKSDFMISKITYKYAKGKRGSHLNLKLVLGIKFSENLKEGVIHFKKINEKIYINYFRENSGRDQYVNRPIKFIENTNDRNKFKFNIKVNSTSYLTNEFLLSKVKFTENNKIKKMDKSSIKKRNSYLSKSNYENKYWSDRKIVINYLKSLQ